MHDSIVSYLLRLANDRPDSKGRVGTLKIYTRRTAAAIRRNLNCLSLDRLVEHLESYGASKADVLSAIGSLNPLLGSGSELHVIIHTDEYKRSLKLRALAQRDDQVENRMEYLRAYGISEKTELPPFETTVN